VVGLVDADQLKPADLVGVNKDSYLILDTLPAEYDSRVKAMEVDEKPTEDYSDIGGLDKQVGALIVFFLIYVFGFIQTGCCLNCKTGSQHLCSDKPVLIVEEQTKSCGLSA
jgi:hypothetical protein